MTDEIESKELVPTPAQVELRSYNRTLAEIEWLLLVLIILYLSIEGMSTSAVSVMSASVLYALFVLAFRYLNLFNTESRWKLSLETWVMILITSYVIWHTGKHESPLVNLYILPIIFAGLTLGKLTSLLQVLLITSLYIHFAWVVIGEDLFTFAQASMVLFNVAPFLLVAYMTSLLAGDMSFARRFTKHLAETDELTGLPNMRAFNIAAEREHARSLRERTPFSILMLDFDNLKNINDRHGHEIGNQLLLHMVGAMKRGTRTSDVVARYGGDEFIILLINADAEVAQEAAERIGAGIANTTFDSSGEQVGTTASIGCATFPQSGETISSLIIAADQAMYASKQRGRNRVIVPS